MNPEDKELNIISHLLELKDKGLSDAQILAQLEKDCPQAQDCLELIEQLKREKEIYCPDKDLLSKIINALPENKANETSFSHGFTKLLSRLHLKIALPVSVLALAMVVLILVNQKQSGLNTPQSPNLEIQGLTNTLADEALLEKTTMQSAKSDIQLINANDANLQELGQFPYDVQF